jgi:hypothetical protein
MEPEALRIVLRGPQWPASTLGNGKTSDGSKFHERGRDPAGRGRPQLRTAGRAFLQEEAFTDEVVLACDGVEACDYLFDPERDESSSLLTPRSLPA